MSQDNPDDPVIPAPDADAVSVTPASAGVSAGMPVSASAGVSADSQPNPRAWLRRWRRVTQPTPDMDDGLSSLGDRKHSLLYRHPFQIGFFLAAGAFTAWGVVIAAVQLQSIILLVLASLCIALGLNRAVEWFHRRGIRRGLCVLIVIVLALIIFALALWAVVPLIVAQSNKLVELAPGWVDALRTNPQIANLDSQFDIIGQLTTFVTNNWKDLAGGVSGGVIGTVNAVAGAVFSVVFGVVLTLYFLIVLPKFKEFIYQLAPASHRPRVKYLANETLTRVGGYVSGLFLVALLDGTFSLIYLNIVGLVGFPGLTAVSLALAVMVALLAFIPLVGSTIYIIILVLVAFTYSPTLGVVTLIVYLVYQQTDAYIIQPRIFAHSVKVPGIVIVLSVISGAFLFGFVGAVLAVPFAGALLVLYREVLVPHLDRN